MKNYEEPKMDVVEIDTTDIIQTSGTLDFGGDTTVPGVGVIVPTPGKKLSSLDSKY
ncbi:MAG: hypothetical protein IKB55_03210 [Clostridia bacterium]|nr:hypothetical protein [Clostridia bacterium]